MGRATIRTAMYQHGTTMTKANGYNFDWSELKSLENGSYVGQSAFNISFGAETNEDDIGGCGSWEYIDRVPVVIAGVIHDVNFSSIGTLEYDVGLLEDKMLDDIKRCFSDTQNGIGDAGGQQLMYKGQNQVSYDMEDATVAEVSLNFELVYRSQR